MTTPRLPNDKNSTSEDRFDRGDDRQYSGWSSAVAIILITIIVGMIFVYLEMHGR